MIGQAIKKAHIRVERLRRIVDRAGDGLRCDEEAACRRNIAATLPRRLASDIAAHNGPNKETTIAGKTTKTTNARGARNGSITSRRPNKSAVSH
jgi:hypothetical protein